MKKILIPALLCLTFAAGCTCENTIRRRADVLVKIRFCRYLQRHQIQYHDF